jgi:5'-deoxynucleotidase YfbR-like HD superfamily hydrolase
MKLTKYQKQGIARAIINDIPRVDYNKRREELQDAVVKIMTAPIAKLYKTNPDALRRGYLDAGLVAERHDNSWIVIGDVPEKQVKTLAEKYRDENDARYAAKRQLERAIDGCNTLKQLMTTLPEFEKYYPTEAQPTKNLPALANVVADLSRLGWPKGEMK